jgi:hypothetical protein
MAAAGLPFEVPETSLGHKVRGMAGRYTNLSDDHIRDAFENLATRWRHEKTASNENRERSA